MQASIRTLVVVCALALPAPAQLLGPMPYTSRQDSPFQPSAFLGYFHLEDGEDGFFHPFGAYSTLGFANPPSAFTDSVDADDGAVDGSGLGGHSFVIASSGNPTGRFRFEGVELGRLPSHVGIVVTDAYDPVLVSFYAWNGALLGTATITGFGPAPDTQGQTAEDRFVGYVHADGIQEIAVTTSGGGGIEIDHLQYGSAQRPFVEYCEGDGSATPCPCGNVGQPGHGCPNSAHAGGARLAGYGHASISHDSAGLIALDLTNGVALWISGTAQTANGSGVALDDGLRCVGGTVTRLARRQIAGGGSGYPNATEPALSTGMSPGGSRHYQVWYRNAAAFCTPGTSNLTNGLTVLWAP